MLLAQWVLYQIIAFGLISVYDLGYEFLAVDEELQMGVAL